MALNNASQVPQSYDAGTISKLFRNIDNESRRTAAYSGKVTWNPGNILDGDSEAVTVVVPGALVANKAHVKVFTPYTLSGMIAGGYLSADNQATIVVNNNTGGAVNLPSGEWAVVVENYIE